MTSKFPVMFVTILGVAAPALAFEMKEASPEMSEFGVETYSSSSPGMATNEVQFYDATGSLIATVDVDVSDTSGMFLEVAQPDAPSPVLSLLMNQAQGELWVQPAQSPVPVSATYDFQDNAWIGDEAARTNLASDYEQEIALAAFALDETLYGGSTPELTDDFNSCSLDSGDSEPISSLDTSCNGIRCRGFATSGAASVCCHEAVIDAGQCCTNGLCIGCCNFMSCDKACGLGDYFCFCGVWGTACSPVLVF